jgi:hypothetical protein
VTGARLVGQLLKRELQLPRTDALRFLAEETLAEHIELMPQRYHFLLRRRELLLEGRDERAGRGEVRDLGRASARRIHCP